MRFSEDEIFLPTEVAGVRFRNPFYVASGPTTMTLAQLVRIEETGWGGASIKLSFDPPPYINRHPRYGYWPQERILSFTTERRMIFEESLRLVGQARAKTSKIVLFSNFTYAGECGIEGWVRMAKGFEAAGAHVNEINMCCPNMSYNVELSESSARSGPRTGASLGQELDAVKAIVAAIKQETAIPLFVKLTPEGGRIAQVARACYQAGADAVGTTANRLAIHHVDVDDPTRSPIHLQREISMQCMSGSWVHPLGLRDVYEIRKVNGPDVDITGAGGVTDWRSAAEIFLCGANLVGICAETLISGFGFLPKLVREFKEWMSRRGFDSVRSMSNVVPPAIRSAPDVTLYPGHARIKNPALSAPCVHACPASVPAQAYISKIAEGEFREAFDILSSGTPLMSICSLVCNHPCEEACTRGQKDEALRIRELKRFLVEKAGKEGWTAGSHIAAPTGKKVSVIGAGPSGLSAAALLARAGHEVTIYESTAEAGGMLRWALPAFRCPRNVVDDEVAAIRSLGVRFEFNRRFGEDLRLEQLAGEFDAVYVAVGAQKPVPVGMKGEESEGVMTALSFLRRIAEGDRPALGQRVAVIGGGFTALDAARTAVRLGAREVLLLYRRTREEMPSSEEEIREAEEEGVRIMYLVAPRQIGVNGGKVIHLVVENQVLAEPGATGRRRPDPVQDATFTLPVDSVITALGERVDLKPEAGLPLTSGGTIGVDDTGFTGLPGVFAGGDASRGAGTVIEAIAAAKKAAVQIDQFLMIPSTFLCDPPPGK